VNLLVTNTHAPQAYAVIRALRPYAEKIVATMEGDSLLGSRFAHAALTRLVDRRRRVPSPVEDWWAGNVGAENTSREEAFVEAILEICRDERIDAIFPSWDPHVYVLAKNRERFVRQGVVLPVPDFETLLTALDKSRTIEAARELGFPIPRSVLHEGGADPRDTAADLGFPLVLKPRFTSGGRGMVVVKDDRELREALPPLIRSHGNPIIQEYVPGGQRGSVQLVVDQAGRVVFAFRKRRRRSLRVTARFGTVSESADPEPEAAEAAALVGRLGLWGAMGIETMLDPRDGVRKLMEINPRFPRQLWNRTALGINEPWMCLCIARGEPVPEVESYPRGVLFVNPVEDAGLLAYQFADRLVYVARRGLQRYEPIDPLSESPPLGELLRSFLASYRAESRKVVDPYSRFFLEDPVASLVWWLQFSGWLLGGWRRLGR